MSDFDFNGDGKHDGFDDFMLFHLVNSSDEDKPSSHTSGDSSGDFSGILAILLIILVISFFI